MTNLKYFTCEFCPFTAENKNITYPTDICRGEHLASYCNIQETEFNYQLTKKHVFYISADYLSTYYGSIFKVKKKLEKFFLEKINFEKEKHTVLYDTNLQICDSCLEKWLKENKLEAMTYFHHENITHPLF